MQQNPTSMINSLFCATLLTSAVLSTGIATATPAVGVTSQPNRNSITQNVRAFQADPSFALWMDSSESAGWDIFQTSNTFAPMDAHGTPSQSGWHDHPTPIAIVQIVQGALWVQEAPDFGCLRYFPTGTVFIEGQGKIHNAFNMDPNVAAIVRTTMFLRRSESSSRTDQPDQITMDPNVASAPPQRMCTVDAKALGRTVAEGVRNDE